MPFWELCRSPFIRSLNSRQISDLKIQPLLGILDQLQHLGPWFHAYIAWQQGCQRLIEEACMGIKFEFENLHYFTFLLAFLPPLFQDHFWNCDLLFSFYIPLLYFFTLSFLSFFFLLLLSLPYSFLFFSPFCFFWRLPSVPIELQPLLPLPLSSIIHRLAYDNHWVVVWILVSIGLFNIFNLGKQCFASNLCVFSWICLS